MKVNERDTEPRPQAETLQAAIDNSADFSKIATDAAGVIQIFNVGAERMLGYAGADVVNRVTAADLSDPQELITRAHALSIEFGTEITSGFEALVFKASRGIEDIYELTYIRKDGSRFPAVVSVTALRDAENVIIGYLLIGTNNTARKQVELKLLKAGALQRAIFNSAHFSSIATDAAGVIQIFNVGAERMLGHTAAEVANRITPADISDPQELIARARALSIELGTEITPGFEALVFKASRGIEDIYELTYIRKDGSRFPAMVSVTALRDSQDAIIGYLLIGTDNTARRQAEEALLKAGALQRAIFNSAHFSKIATDAAGVIQIFNVGAERMLGYTMADVMNRVTPADLSDPQELIARAHTLSIELGTEITPGFEALVFKASRGIEDIYELTYIRKDGSRFPAMVSVTALRDGQDAIIGYLLIGTDNTARRQAEEALLKAGALQRAIFNSAHFSSIATDATGVIQIFNVGAERMLGYTAAEVANRITPADISDPEEVIARAQALSDELGTKIAPGFEALVFKASRGIEDIYELTYIRKDGSRFPAMVSVTALRDAHDVIIGYLLIGTDNTARKLVEAQQNRLDQLLRDQQFYTRSLIESTLDALMATDPSGVITDVNQQMEALTGCTRDELIGAPFKNYFTDPARAEAGITLVLREKKVADYELTARSKDGKNTDVSYNATTFYDRDGTLQGVFASARDMTERKRADKALRQADARMSALAQALDSFAIVEVTDTEGRITYANEMLCLTSKYSCEELLGRTHREVGSSGHHSREFWQEMWRTIGGGQIWRGEIKNRAKDGSIYWVDTAIVPRHGGDGMIEAYMAIRFVTTERNMLEQVREDALQAKEEVLSHVSHELRTPLAAIDWFATNLRVGLLGALTAEQYEHLDTILGNVKQLKAMIGDFLDATRASSGKLSIAHCQMNLPTVVGEAVATCQSLAAEAGVELLTPAAANLPLVWADPDRTRQVLINLINNAVKFTPAGGVVTVDGQVTDERDFVRMSVVDTGCGIAKENCEHVFERLFQQVGASEASRKGLGLGLFISKEIVVLQNGRISVDSELGRGSTFSFTVPVFSLRRLCARVLTARNLEAGRMTVITLKTFPEDETADAMTESGIATRAMLEGSVLAGQDLVVPGVCGPGTNEPFFVVAGTDGIGAEVIMRRIREHLTAATFSKNVRLPPTLSMSVVEYPKPAEQGIDASIANFLGRLATVMSSEATVA